jgi:DDE superfamily endonuclease
MLSLTKEDMMPKTVDRKMVRSWTEELDAVGERLSAHFARSEVRQRATDYLRGLLSVVERKNSWQLAEVAGNSTPYGIQHLLGRANWDADAVRDDLRGYVVEHLADDESILIVDETGFIKKEEQSVGVKRQWASPGKGSPLLLVQQGRSMIYKAGHETSHLRWFSAPSKPLSVT